VLCWAAGSSSQPVSVGLVRGYRGELVLMDQAAESVAAADPLEFDHLAESSVGVDRRCLWGKERRFPDVSWAAVVW
jgi:hypothetical protein